MRLMGTVLTNDNRPWGEGPFEDLLYMTKVSQPVATIQAATAKNID